MESPVRICLSAAIVIHLLLLSSSNVNSSAIPPATSSESATTNAHRSGYVRVNSTTWVPRKTNARSTEDPSAANDINPKETDSQENKDERARARGAIRYNQQKYKSSTPPTRRRNASSTKKPDILIVTPSAEPKNISQIINSMKKFKTSKIMSSSTTAMPERDKEEASTEADHYDSYENYDISKFTSSEFHDEDNVYTLPGFSASDIYPERNKKDKKTYIDPNNSPFERLSSSKPRKTSDSSRNRPNNDFSSYDHFSQGFDLTTPRNDIFDERFREITQSILENLDKHKLEISKEEESRRDNFPDIDVTKSLNVEELVNRKPKNNSKMYFHKSKSILVSDNEPEGSSLSDVQGTSIYFEHSMLSTESYGDFGNDDDCDNETLIEEPTPAPSPLNEISTKLKTTVATIVTTESSVSTYYPSRNSRVSPKRINFSPLQNKDITNDDSFTKKSEDISSNHLRPLNRRIQFTSPKPRTTYRMSVKKNQTTLNTKSNFPTTIYAEHFNVKDHTLNVVPEKKQSILTTVSSDIDPNYEPEISGIKKIVHSHTISDNSIPSLRKRGSTRYTGSSTATPTSAKEESSTNYMALPPTSSAWGALAGMRNPPSLTSPTLNATSPSNKNIDENELQRVAESSDNPIYLSTASTTTISDGINVDLFALKTTQEWKPLLRSSEQNSVTNAHSASPTTEKVNKIEINPISLSLTESLQTSTLTNELSGDSEADASSSDVENTSVITDWIPVNSTSSTNTKLNLSGTEYSSRQSEITSTKSPPRKTFESITKIPSDKTTPQFEDAIVTTEIPHFKNNSDITIHSTPDVMLEATTFTYIPISTIASPVDTTTNTNEDQTLNYPSMETIAPESWHPVLPSRKATPVTKKYDDVPITTYRPTYMTTFQTKMETEIVTQYPIFTTPDPEITTITMMDEYTTKHENVVILTASDESLSAVSAVETTTVDVKIPTTIVMTTEQITTKKAELVKEEQITPEPTTAESVTVASTSENSLSSAAIETEENNDKSSETNKDNEVISKEVITETEVSTVILQSTTAYHEETTTSINAERETTVRTVSKLEDLTSNFSGDLTTQAPYNKGDPEPSSAAGVAIAVSAIGVIALLLVIGLLLVLRRRRLRGRRCGVYAQRCTPVSLDAYSLDSVSVGRRKGTHRLRASKRSYGNPAYDDEVVISHPMQYAALANFALDAESMAAEFTEIPAGSVRADEVPQGCEDKNRFSNVLPLPETRVPLQRLDNDPTTEYINANYVTGPGSIKNYYIACQAPMSNTVSDFWRMIWEQNSRVIVMLTEYMENGVERCYEYLPPSEVTDNKRTFDNFQIILKRREHKDKYAVSSLQLTNLTTKTWREVSHLWYFWPAKGVPDDYDSVINFMSEMRSHMKISQNAKEFDEDDAAVTENGSANNLSKLKSESPPSSKGVNVYSPAKAEEMMRKTNGTNGTLGRMKAAAELEGVRPCVVTCSSGAGRTGALLALDICARALEGSGTVDVPRTVRSLRSARPHALQNKNQYIFLYKVLNEYGNKLTGGGVDSI